MQIEPEVLNAPQRFGHDISAILERCNLGQHQWVIDDLDVVLQSSWMQGRARWDATEELAEKTYRAQLDEPVSAAPKRLLVVSLAPGAAERSSEAIKVEAPPRARQILEQALFLLLENGTADWRFLDAMSRTYTRREILDAFEERWLLPEHAGGKGELRKRCDELIRRGVPPWRIVVLMDSDRLAPGPLPEENEKKRIQLEELGAKVLVLFKREAENYLPPSLLYGKPHREVRSSLSTLTRTQQDHYDMRRLAGGFGSSIGDRFQGAVIDRWEMDHVCATCPGELEALFVVIEGML